MTKLKKITDFLLRKKVFFLGCFISGIFLFVALIPAKAYEKPMFWRQSTCWMQETTNIDVGDPPPLPWCESGSYRYVIGSRCYVSWGMDLKCTKEIRYDTHGPYLNPDGTTYYREYIGYDCLSCRECSYCTGGCGDYSCASTEKPTNWDCSSGASGEYSYGSCTYDCVASASCAPTCTASCGSWSACSVSCGGGTQTRTCTRTDCSTYNQSQACNTQPCCVPSCSCALNTCVGNTCSDGCGGTCSGTKTCPSSTGCDNKTYDCSISNVYQERGDYKEMGCSSGSCLYIYKSWLDSICGDEADDQPCGTATCDNPCTYQYCTSPTEVAEVTEGIRETCTSGPTGGCGTELNSNCYGTTTSIKTCEQGEVCAEIAGTQCNGHSEVDCVPKATTWTEE